MGPTSESTTYARTKLTNVYMYSIYDAYYIERNFNKNATPRKILHFRFVTERWNIQIDFIAEDFRRRTKAKK